MNLGTLRIHLPRVYTKSTRHFLRISGMGKDIRFKSIRSAQRPKHIEPQRAETSKFSIVTAIEILATHLPRRIQFTAVAKSGTATTAKASSSPHQGAYVPVFYSEADSVQLVERVWGLRTSAEASQGDGSGAGTGGGDGAFPKADQTVLDPTGCRRQDGPASTAPTHGEQWLTHREASWKGVTCIGGNEGLPILGRDDSNPPPHLEIRFYVLKL
ncbi:uncharacterized protein VTP21DRAFT_7257 [Calcarisporiella thermophila]|uniref:uncharacterized protein n=1 Tax=Calcarisporiella thermophila TaxID=911321 RepID=UPI003742E2AE